MDRASAEYRDYYYVRFSEKQMSAIDSLSNEDAGQLLKASIHFIKGEEIELSGMAQLAFEFMRGDFERDRDSVINSNRARRENGEKGGRPKKNPPADKMSIETWYNGFKFRSRLEARWAVYFDAMGIEYQYEVQGYNLTRADGSTVGYLPDFYFPRCKSWGEVKGVMTDADREKIELFREQVGEVTVYGNIQDIDPMKINDKRMRIAFGIARSARFEWGDTPDPNEVREEAERMLSR